MHSPRYYSYFPTYKSCLQACIKNADSEKMTKPVKLVGMLLQAKTCLFWKRK